MIAGKRIEHAAVRREPPETAARGLCTRKLIDAGRFGVQKRDRDRAARQAQSGGKLVLALLPRRWAGIHGVPPQLNAGMKGPESYGCGLHLEPKRSGLLGARLEKLAVIAAPAGAAKRWRQNLRRALHPSAKKTAWILMILNRYFGNPHFYSVFYCFSLALHVWCLYSVARTLPHNRETPQNPN